MKRFRNIDYTTIEITDEDGNKKEWVRSDQVRGNEKYDFSHEMSINGVWYVTTKADASGDEEE